MESKWRSFWKSIAWRVISTINGFLVTWWFTRQLGAAVSIAVAANITGLILYYGHERVWNKIKWGITHE